jgi:hypothetical protein
MNAASLRGSESSFFLWVAFITITNTGVTGRYIVSWAAETPGGLKATSEPVETACMSWARATLFVRAESLEIKTRIAVIATVNARKNRNQYAP